VAQVNEKAMTGSILPFFNLASTRGKYIKPWDFKQRKNLVLYFFSGADCAECQQTLKAFSENYYDYRRLNAEVLAIATDSLENLERLARELELKFPLLSDDEGKATNIYTKLEPGENKAVSSIFVADRYGGVEEEWVSKPEDKLPGQPELLATLQLLELRCPE
jgi:peroxiredoxin Q/BCP